MDMDKLRLVIEVTIESVRCGDIGEEQAMRFLIWKYEEMKNEATEAGE